MLTYYYGDTQDLTIKINRINRSVYQIRTLGSFEENLSLICQIQKDIRFIFRHCDPNKRVDRRWFRLNKLKLKKILKQTQKLSKTQTQFDLEEEGFNYV